ncbi:site-specific DNA-methyltransferase (adenine-specific) [Nannocystis exedens]|uniref:Methyltransferase n=1 Tax=Nannocystis exedens TaxID=54 RepID=A0A1I1YRV4_9BACT|nr:DNA methyltransferase [Nannocystis exedens]SFE22247.1 site-specific DNA-methyltransferase (adenine-specific) [Nannocystis exedens]
MLQSVSATETALPPSDLRASASPKAPAPAPGVQTPQSGPARPTSARATTPAQKPLPEPTWRSADNRARLYKGDCLEILERIPAESVDVIFADPPYFLSNGGTTCRAGKRTSVDKGAWDKSNGVEENHAFNHKWLSACQRALKPNGTMWVSGTGHVIYSVGYAMQQLGFKMLNEIVWEKPNPPPNLSCRYFTHATETLLWAAKSRKSRHTFNYDRMREMNDGKQMKTVWRLTAPGQKEKLLGRHPTQKPIALLERLLLASCPDNSLVLDPFNGSGTTGVAAVTLGHSYMGIDLEQEYIDLTQARLLDAVPSLRERPALQVVR